MTLHILDREPIKDDEPPAPLGPPRLPPMTWPATIALALGVILFALAAWFDEELGWWAYLVWLYPAAIAGVLAWRHGAG